MEMPDFEKEARLTVDRLWQARVSPSPYTQEVFDAATAVIAAALRKVHTDALESAAKAVLREKRVQGLARVTLATAIRALATKEDGNG